MSPSLSQVLLTDEGWRQRCVASVPEAEFGVEWAAGRGALTDLLETKWTYLLALELDASFCRELRHTFSPGAIGVVRADILNYPLIERDTPYPLVGNLPYHLTGPLLEKLARESRQLDVFHGLVQWEVAERIGAGPGDSEYRSISVLMNWAFDVQVLHRVPKTAFTPQPEVDSGWIRLKPRQRDRPFEPFSDFVRTMFKQPRKTLLNNLADSTPKKADWRDWMKTRGWNEKRRPGSLTVDEVKEAFDRWARESSS